MLRQLPDRFGVELYCFELFWQFKMLNRYGLFVIALYHFL